MKFLNIFRRHGNTKGKEQSPFGDLISEELANEIAEILALDSGLHRSDIVFVLIQVREERMSDIVATMDDICHEFLKHDAFWERMFSTIALVTLGCRPGNEREVSLEDLEHLVQCLVKKFGSEVRILYGRSDGYYGTAKGDNIHEYGAIMFNIEEKLVSLFKTDYGAANSML